MKKAFRKDILHKRKQLSQEKIKEKSKKIGKNLFDLDVFNKENNVMFFVSFGKEVYTHDMIEKCFEERVVIVPKAFGDYLLPCKINSLGELRTFNFGIKEPIDEDVFPLGEIDVIVVPGLAFNEKGERIGYGKGFYDRFLSKCNAIKVGLCFEEFIVDKIPTQDHDIKVDFIITEDRVINVNK